MDSMIIDPKTGKLLAQISLIGEPVPADAMSSSNGRLQGYVILSEKNNLWRPWVEQQMVLLRTADAQRLVRIATFPMSKDEQGYLDIISVANDNNAPPAQPQAWAT